MTPTFRIPGGATVYRVDANGLIDIDAPYTVEDELRGTITETIGSVLYITDEHGQEWALHAHASNRVA